MDGMERIHELLDQLIGEVEKLFPGMTDASFAAGNDGYRSVCVQKWKMELGVTVDKAPRRALLDQWRNINGEWSEDASERQNEYYKKNGVLLKEGA